MKHFLLVAPAILLLGCGDAVEQFVTPDQVTDFTTLFQSNCAGCHGRDGRSGAARPVNDAMFLAAIGRKTLGEVIAKGVRGTPMPAFAQSAGGSLTDRQVRILADEMMKRWSRPQDFSGSAMAPYRGDLGDAKAGGKVFHTHCARCHGAEGSGTQTAGSVTDPSFLALVSDQSLRTSLLVGRGNCPPLALAGDEVSSVVAWFSAHRLTPVNQTQRGTP